MTASVRHHVKTPLLWTLAFAVHAIAQFAAWAYADGSRLTTAASDALADALMFPAFTFVGTLADRLFWPIFVVNSAVWASAITLGLRAMRSRA